MSDSLTWLIGLVPGSSSTIPTKKASPDCQFVHTHPGTRLWSGVVEIQDGAAMGFCLGHRTVQQDTCSVTDSPKTPVQVSLNLSRT